MISHYINGEFGQLRSIIDQYLKSRFLNYRIKDFDLVIMKMALILEDGDLYTNICRKIIEKTDLSNCNILNFGCNFLKIILKMKIFVLSNVITREPFLDKEKII